MANQFTSTDSKGAAAPTATSLNALCFTAERPDGGVDLWRPAEVDGGWQKQNAVGRGYADEAITYIRAANDGAMLPGIVRAIAKRGTFGGVEVGFFAALSERL